MQYRDTTFSLYAELFNEAHQALTKEAGFGKQIGRALDWGRRAVMKPGNVQKLEHESGRLRQAVDDAAKRLSNAEHQSKYWEQLASKNVAAPQKAVQGRNLALGALGVTGVAGIPGAYYAGQEAGEKNKIRTRNLAFGAGAASGLAAPHLIHGLSNIAQSAGNTGLFPELQGLSGSGYSQGGY